MSNKLSAVLILCMSTVGLAGCDLLRATGPCYGVGCPGGTPGHSGQYKPGEAPKAQNASAPAPATVRTAAASAQPNTVQPNAPAQTTSASASPQPAAAQSSATQSSAAQADGAQAANAQSAAAQPSPAASPEAKSSPLHSIGEFFARLIPHHNSGAKSGASD
jgi:hypothetical protein